MLRKTSPSRKAFLVVNTIVLGLITLLCFYPFWYILVYSLSDATKAQAGVTFWFKGFSLNNFVKVMELKGIGSAVFVSVARTLLGTLLTVFACTFMGYLFTKEELPARKFIYRALIVTMYVGGGLIPTYLTISAYKLVNTFWVYVVPSVVSAYNVILVKTFVEQLPASLEESAVLDGAGAFTVYRCIILPLSKPIVATIATFTAVGHWNQRDPSDGSGQPGNIDSHGSPHDDHGHHDHPHFPGVSFHAEVFLERHHDWSRKRIGRG